jgi:hypothetical protein
VGGMANRFWRIVARVLGVLCMLCASGSCGHRSVFEEPGFDHPDYGPVYVELPIGDVGYQPPSPVHVGTVLTFTAQLPQGEISAAIVSAGFWAEVELLDDGVLPDQEAGDRTFTGQLEWKAEYGTGKMSALLSASGTLNGRDASGGELFPQLTVLP